jgi:RimJ/RimL family protein N-acetyltransferase
MAEIVAETARLVLRREIDGDQAVWLAHMNTPRVMEHLGGPQSPEKVAEGFARMAAAHAAGGYSFVLVALKSDGMLIGKCGLAAIETPAAPEELHGRAQVGWTLRADCWGHGYAREAAEAALELAFDHYALPLVYGQTSERNVPSWRLIERLGMSRQSELDYVDPDYAPHDNPTKVYALARSAWRARRA